MLAMAAHGEACMRTPVCRALAALSDHLSPCANAAAAGDFSTALEMT
jgi:hypothetical protein